MSSILSLRQPRFTHTLLAPALIALVVTCPSNGQNHEKPAPSTPNRVQDDPRYGQLSPLPETGGIPAIYDKIHGPSARELEQRARVREYEKQLRLLRRAYFQSLKRPDRVKAGLAELAEFTDPAAFRPMLAVFHDCPDAIRLAVIEHVAGQGEFGQAAVADYVIEHSGDDAEPVDLAVCSEATMLLSEQLNGRPTPQPVLQVLDRNLRSPVHQTANNAGALAGAINAVETIPLLIFAQATQDAVDEPTGDLAWIAIQTQTAYVANVQPVVGDDSGAFQPVLGVLNEGVVLRVWDAVAVNYRTFVHRSLVAMTTHEWGESTEHLGYDMKAWWNWYNDEYVPFRNEQAARARLNELNPQPPAEAEPPHNP